MKFKYSGSKDHFQIRWASEQQLNSRWNELVVTAYAKAEKAFKSTTRAIKTPNSVAMPSSMMIEAVANSVDLSFQQMTSQLDNYRNAVVNFITNAFRHVSSYEDPDNFFVYIEQSKNVALEDLNTLSRSGLVYELKKHYEGLDTIFSTHAEYIKARVDTLQKECQTKQEGEASHKMTM